MDLSDTGNDNQNSCCATNHNQNKSNEQIQTDKHSTHPDPSDEQIQTDKLSTDPDPSDEQIQTDKLSTDPENERQNLDKPRHETNQTQDESNEQGTCISILTVLQAVLCVFFL